MVFWIAVAVLSAAVTFAVTRPLLRERDSGSAVRDADAADLAVYKDQLAEIDADAARGLLSEGEADAARAEVARRVLRKADAATRETLAPEATGSRQPKSLYLAATLALPMASLALYLVYGAPGLPGAPLSSRLASPLDASNMEDLVAKVEARLRTHPNEGRGWDVIAPVYMSLGRFADAASAYANAARLLGETPKRSMGFAEARIRAENGVIPDEARKALKSVVAADPKNVEARIWLALAKVEDGDTSGAATDLRTLISEAPDGAPYKTLLERRLALIENPNAGQPSQTTAETSGPGPTADDVSAASQMPAADRQAMIEGMVGRLAERLKTDSKDKEGWQRLIRAYQVLGRKDDALKAVASAKAGLAGDAEAVREIDAFAKSLGIGG